MHAYWVAVEYLAAHGNNEKAHSSRAFAMLYKCNKAKEEMESGNGVYALELATEVIETIRAEEWV